MDAPDFPKSKLWRDHRDDFWYLVAAFAIVVGREAATAKEAGEHFIERATAVDFEAWTWLQAFLAACGTVSHFLWFTPRALRRQKRLGDEDAVAVRDALRSLFADIDLEPLRGRAPRDYFEHIDERVEEWWLESGRGVLVDGVLALSDGKSTTWLARHDSPDALRSVVIDQVAVVLRGETYEVRPMLRAVSAIASRSDDAVRSAGRHAGTVVAVGGPTPISSGQDRGTSSTRPRPRGR